MVETRIIFLASPLSATVCLQTVSACYMFVELKYLHDLVNIFVEEYKALQVQADVTRDEDCRRIVESTVNHFGKIDILSK